MVGYRKRKQRNCVTTNTLLHGKYIKNIRRNKIANVGQGRIAPANPILLSLIYEYVDTMPDLPKQSLYKSMPAKVKSTETFNVFLLSYVFIRNL